MTQGSASLATATARGAPGRVRASARAVCRTAAYRQSARPRSSPSSTTPRASRHAPTAPMPMPPACARAVTPAANGATDRATGGAPICPDEPLSYISRRDLEARTITWLPSYHPLQVRRSRGDLERLGHLQRLCLHGRRGACGGCVRDAVRRQWHLAAGAAAPVLALPQLRLRCLQPTGWCVT